MKRHNRASRKSAGSSLMGPSANSRTWNVISQNMPGFNNTLKKDNSVHKFIQTTDLNTVMVSQTTGPTYYARSFTAQDLAQWSQILSIFDQYRIDEIEVWLEPGIGAPGNPAGTGASQTVTSVIDYDDDASPSSINTLQQYTNAIVTNPLNGHYRKWKPHCADALYSGAFTSYGNILAPWIDAASPTVKHYGFKCGVTAAPTAGTVTTFKLTLRMHFSTRNVF